MTVVEQNMCDYCFFMEILQAQCDLARIVVGVGCEHGFKKSGTLENLHALQVAGQFQIRNLLPRCRSKNWRYAAAGVLLLWNTSFKLTSPRPRMQILQALAKRIEQEGKTERESEG